MTMTELEHYDQTQPPTTVEVHQSVTQSNIRRAALEMADAHKIATAICRSAFVPTHLRGNADETAVAILYGATVGFDPITAVQQIFAIGGKPALYARAMVAIVLKAGHEIWTEEEGPGHVTVAGKRKGSEHITRVTWTSEMAHTAGYDKNPKYRTDSRAMLYARASGDVARRIAPDALMGMSYNVEEMQLVPVDAAPPTVERATPQTQKDRVMAAIGKPVAPTETTGPADAGETPAPEQTPAAPAAGPEDNEPSITSAQSKKLHTLVGKLGLDRDAKLHGISVVVGREIGSTSELTKGEAKTVIESLQARLDLADQEPVDAVVLASVDDVIAEAQRQGMDMWQLESAFESDHDTQLDKADSETLGVFLAALKERVA